MEKAVQRDSSTPLTKPKLVVVNGHDKHNEQDIDQLIEELNRKKQAIEEQKVLEAENLKKEQLLKIEELLVNVAKYEEWAKDEAAKKDKDQGIIDSYLTMSREARASAQRIKAELGLLDQEKVILAEPENSSHPRWMPFLQIGGLLTLIWGCYQKFFSIQKEIAAHNSLVEPYAQIRAHDLDSIQKMYFEKLTLGTDLLLLIGIISLIAPSISLYVLPFQLFSLKNLCYPGSDVFR